MLALRCNNHMKNEGVRLRNLSVSVRIESLAVRFWLSKVCEWIGKSISLSKVEELYN